MSIEGEQALCALTIPRLARRANGELDRFSAAALAAHLEACLVGRAAEARQDRAERAFTAVLGPVPVIAEPPEAGTAPVIAEPPEAETVPVSPPATHPTAAALAALPAEHDEPAPLEVQE